MFKIKILSGTNDKQCYDLLSYSINEPINFQVLGWSENQLKSQFNKKINFGLGLFDNNVILAFIVGNLLAIEKNTEYEILILYVSSQSRKLGYASILLNNIPLYLKNKKLKKIYLEVAKDNIAAINLYEKNNYIKTGIRKKYYNIKNRKIDAYFFEKEINE